MARTKQTNQPATDARTDDGATRGERRSQWAREKARLANAIESGNGADVRSVHRFAKLRDVLVCAALDGETSLSFAEANRRADLARGRTGNPAASWRLALQRTREVFGDAAEVYGWRVDGDAGKLVYTRAD